MPARLQQRRRRHFPQPPRRIWRSFGRIRPKPVIFYAFQPLKDCAHSAAFKIKLPFQARADCV
ncbi:hypothetical protein BEN74_10275 [Acinetobacter sp. WCHAc010034]|nr:hypothetical protein BEN74_10275 [Acinetobacter sp. WCHAc010034]